MKISNRLKRVVTYLSISALVLSNGSLVLAAEDAPLQPPTAAEGNAAPKPHAGVHVQNVNGAGTKGGSSYTQEQLEAFKAKAKNSLKEAAMRDFEKKQSEKATASEKLSAELHKPDEIVNVIVELKGQTISQALSASGTKPGVNATSVESSAHTAITADIKSAKNQVISTLSTGKSKSTGPVFHFKHDYENVFKGFSLDDIKYSDIDAIKKLPNVKAVTLQQTFLPAVNEQHDLTGIKNLWNGSATGEEPIGYKGEGMVIAIVDTGIDPSHEAFPAPHDMSKAKYKHNEAPFTDKVVGGYNWADQNEDITPRMEWTNLSPSSHGVHVAGIAAGSSDVLQGVAPEAQLIAEKVFSETQAGALTEDIIKGIDHATAMKADVINMSLGASSTFDTRDANDPMGIAIRNATDAGVVVVVAAGNASNAYDDKGESGASIKLGETPDLNKIGNPGVYPDSFTVAAANNSVVQHDVSFSYSFDAPFITGHGLDVWKGLDVWENDSISLVGLRNDHLGYDEDYDGVDVAGKVVLIKRGSLTFNDKVKIAKEHGAIGAIVYNSDAGKKAPTPQGQMEVPFSFISYEDGTALEAALASMGGGGDGGGGGIDIGPLSGVDIGIDLPPEPGASATLPMYIETDETSSAFEASAPGSPTDFSSWGTTSDLLLKPEIMAPGHKIVSSVRTSDPNVHNAYESEDGTSMAAPYVAGAVADVMQAFKKKGFQPGTRSFVQLVKNVVMNTSVPAKRDYENEENPADRADYNTEYQPRRQGAGMIRPDLAVQTPVVVSGPDGTGRVSLKEIGAKTTFTLTASNLTSTAATYELSGTVMTDLLHANLDTSSDNIRSRYLEHSKLSFSPSKITVGAKSTQRVTVTLTVDPSEMKNTFIEGYVYLTPTDEDLPTLNVPYTGFNGKWDAPAIIDAPSGPDSVWGSSGLGTQMAFVDMHTGFPFLYGEPKDNYERSLGDKFFAFSPVNALYAVPVIALLRDARNVKVDVVDAEHNLVTHLTNDDWVVKNDPYSGGIAGSLSAGTMWDGTNLGVPVPDGQYYFAITATADAPNAKPQPTIYMPAYKDTHAPSVDILKHVGYDELNEPDETNTGEYTLRFKMDDDADAPNGESGGDWNIYYAINGSEPYTNYKDDVKRNDDGTYEMPIKDLRDGLNVISIAPIDRVGNYGEEYSVIVNNTNKAVWIDIQSASVNGNPRSVYYDANVKRGDSFDLSFDAYGKNLDSVQVQFVKTNEDGSKTIVGEPIDNVGTWPTPTPFGTGVNYSISAHVVIPDSLPDGKYSMNFVCLGEGQTGFEPNLPYINIDTYVDETAPAITFNTGDGDGSQTTKAYFVPDTTNVSLMLNATVTDLIKNGRGFKVEYSLDGGDPVVMGSKVNPYVDDTFRYPVVITDEDQHTLVITATDYMENSSSIQVDYHMNLSEKQVVMSVGDDQEAAIPIMDVPANLATYDGSIFIDLGSSVDGKIHEEFASPYMYGTVTSQYGNDGTVGEYPYYGVRDYYPILLTGDHAIKTDLKYDPAADQYYFTYQPLGYEDAGDIVEGESTHSVTMIDFLGNQTTIPVTVIKNTSFPYVQFDDTVIDQSTGTATFFTDQTSFEISGTVHSEGAPFYTVLKDTRRGPEDYVRNLFGSEWGNTIYYEDFTFPEGFEQPAGVHPFTITVDNLHPGINMLEIDGDLILDGKVFYGNHPLVFNLIVYRLGASEAPDSVAAAQSAAALTWDQIKGWNESQNAIETNLNLPYRDEAGQTQISWSSNEPSIINSLGAVTRPAVDTPVTLTATVTKGSETATKSFEFTVLAKLASNQSAVNQDKVFLDWSVISGGNGSQDDVTLPLTLPTSGANGTTITWSSDDTAHITDAGRVYKPLFDESDAVVVLKATVQRGSTKAIKTFSLTVKPDANNAERTALIHAVKSLTLKQLLGENKSELDVTHDITLPTTVGDASVTWLSDAPEVIAADGKITRPAQNQYVMVEGLFNIGQFYKYASFGFYVRSEDANDNAPVQAAQASIVWNLIKRNNVDQNTVTSDLYLPTQGANDTTITWTSSNPQVIGTDGTVHRMGADETVVLTATTTKNAATPLTKEFELIVKKAASGNPGMPGTPGTPENPGTPGTPDPGTPDPDAGTAIQAPVTETNAVEGGRNTTTITVDEAGLLEQLQNSADGVTVTISTDKVTDVTTGVLTGQLVQHLVDKQATVTVVTPEATYTIDAAQLADALKAQLGTGVSLSDVQIELRIANSQAAERQAAQEAATNNGVELVGYPVSFEIIASHDGHETVIDQFNSYVERDIVIPAGNDGEAVTAVVVDEDGNMRQVPTYFETKDGKQVAKVYSLTNSLYALVSSHKTFTDIKGWAKASIENLASRLIVKGQGDGMFNPNGDMTRAEFATIIVNALGMKTTDAASPFKDVSADAWYAGAISAAAHYGIVTGVTTDTFAPSKKVTRQEAMVMLTRAMTIAGIDTTISASDIKASLDDFKDGSSVSEWAQAFAAINVKFGLITGDQTHSIHPKSNITRAEVASIIERMLKKASLIN
ncbi:immunoglobulin-like domain-containing protein [Paenibacillus sp. OV219]|uniref:immunoglobulin-like domain-containing protein n=1 Tax=Paenibacillus sp. OV219 TaxID=1884377 RepID=UPI0008D21BA9|nr:immunoglobulin-like domain-containing protein [Paenibacillus sp. OV219]SEO88102.1 S-layer homology domain-containing protein [Paenibacillus sp. OV219]